MFIYALIASIVAVSCVRDEVALLALANSGSDGVEVSLLTVSIVDISVWDVGVIVGGPACVSRASWTPCETSSIN